jgi:hypothetical protein
MAEQALAVHEVAQLDDYTVEARELAKLPEKDNLTSGQRPLVITFLDQADQVVLQALQAFSVLGFHVDASNRIVHSSQPRGE